MNCKPTPIDAGYVSLALVHVLHGQFMQLTSGRTYCTDTLAALHPCPGEGPGES